MQRKSSKQLVDSASECASKDQDTDTKNLEDMAIMDIEQQEPRLQHTTSFYSEKIAGVSVYFRDVHYKVFLRKNCYTTVQELRILSSVTGSLQPESMIALMGPSGSGKTTLLDVLAGRKTTGKIEGHIWFDGTKPTKRFLRRYTGYVEQFDTLCHNLTVYEMLLYTAEMKLDRRLKFQEKREIVDKLLEFLGLEKARDTRIGNSSRRGISGGQAKRVNIGVSLVSSPRLLFLDEPTTGLDSFMANEVMQFIKERLASHGMTVCASIHSPSPHTFGLFDQLLLLVGGRLVYFGPNSDHCTDYFLTSGLLPPEFGEVQQWRQAEWVMDVVTAIGHDSKLLDSFVDYYSGSKEGKEATARMPSPRATEAAAEAWAKTRRNNSAVDLIEGEMGTTVPSWYALRKIFYYRTLRNYQDPMFLSARLVDKVIVVMILCTLYYGYGSQQGKYVSLSAALWMWAIQPSFGAAAYLPTLMLERNLYTREHSDGLYTSYAYYVSKWIEELPMALPASLVFCLAVYFALDLSGSFAVFWLSFLLCLLASIGTAYCFATLCPTIDFANGAVPSYGGTLLFFTGFLIPLNQIGPWWYMYTYTDYLRYPYTMMMVNHYSNVPNGTAVLDLFGMNEPWMNAATHFPIMAGFAIMFATLGLVIHMLLRYGAR